jgi:hypothetical protein
MLVHKESARHRNPSGHKSNCRLGSLFASHLLNQTVRSPIRSKPAHETGGLAIKNLPGVVISPREAGRKILVIKKAKNLQSKSNQKVTEEKSP